MKFLVAAAHRVLLRWDSPATHKAKCHCLCCRRYAVGYLDAAREANRERYAATVLSEAELRDMQVLAERYEGADS